MSSRFNSFTGTRFNAAVGSRFNARGENVESFTTCSEYVISKGWDLKQYQVTWTGGSDYHDCSHIDDSDWYKYWFAGASPNNRIHIYSGNPGSCIWRYTATATEPHSCVYSCDGSKGYGDLNRTVGRWIKGDSIGGIRLYLGTGDDEGKYYWSVYTWIQHYRYTNCALKTLYPPFNFGLTHRITYLSPSYDFSNVVNPQDVTGWIKSPDPSAAGLISYWPSFVVSEI